MVLAGSRPAFAPGLTDAAFGSGRVVLAGTPRRVEGVPVVVSAWAAATFGPHGTLTGRPGYGTVAMPSVLGAWTSRHGPSPPCCVSSCVCRMWQREPLPRLPGPGDQ